MTEPSSVKRCLMVAYNKLVRDFIPEIIQANGQTPIARILSPEEFLPALKEKILEEAKELHESFSSHQTLEELADLSECIDALLQALGVSHKQLHFLQETKRQERGGFNQRIFLEKVLE
jgi:predicted house-cleaning noncanonical NTP pyrophosphatase (MazG superfamily)